MIRKIKTYIVGLLVSLGWAVSAAVPVAAYHGGEPGYCWEAEYYGYTLGYWDGSGNHYHYDIYDHYEECENGASYWLYQHSHGAYYVCTC